MAYRRRSVGTGSLHDPDLLAAALVGYEHERAVIVEKIAEIQRQLGGRGAQTATSADGAGSAGRRTMSAAARKRIAAAQRKRWAAFHNEHRPAAAKKTSAAPKASAKPMRRMSAEARKRIAEAARKRWAAYRAKKAAPKAKNAA